MHNLHATFENLKTYKHIKVKTHYNKRNYLIFDIDNIDINKVDFLFNNDFFIPNYYIYEFSEKKQCYTLQVFLLLDNHIIINDNLIDNYKKLCNLFGCDNNYQLKTGIHKNPDYERFKKLRYKNKYDTIEIIKNDFINKINHVGIIHNDPQNFDAIINNFQVCGYFDNIDIVEKSTENEKIKVKIKPVNEVKRSKNNKNEKGTRNITLFNETRLIAYSLSDKSYENILHVANKINNNFNTPLKSSEVKKTVKSIYNFINKEFKNIVQPYNDLQRQASAATRKEKSIDKIANAIIQLVANNKAPTISAIRKITGQNLKLIKSYLELGKVRAVELTANKKRIIKPTQEFINHNYDNDTHTLINKFLKCKNPRVKKLKYYEKETL